MRTAKMTNITRTTWAAAATFALVASSNGNPIVTPALAYYGGASAPTSAHMSAGMLLATAGTGVIAVAPPEGVRTPDNAALIYVRYWQTVPGDFLREIRDAHKFDAAWEPDEALTAKLAAHQGLVAGVLRAASIDKADWGVELELGFDALLPHLAPVRQTQSLLDADALRLLKSGDQMAAAERLSAMFRISDHTGRDVLISSLVGAAMGKAASQRVLELIEAGRVTPAMAKTILQGVRAIDRDDLYNFRECLVIEEWMVAEHMATQFRGADAGKKFAEMMRGFDENNAALDGLERLSEKELAAELGKARGYYVRVREAWDGPDALKQLGELESMPKDALARQFGRAIPALAASFVKARRSYEDARDRLAAVEKALVELAAK
ncbi:MAG: hypothetical protein SFZ23_02830 [Planctomycetota bacterium]|nr:hypothetical protein [Planctomycetota bacterium]